MEHNHTATDLPHYETIHEGPFATVLKLWVTLENGHPGWLAVKSSSTNRKFAKEPHDIIKECRLLSLMKHNHVVSMIDAFQNDEDITLEIYMEYIPRSLTSILSSPKFSPFPDPTQGMVTICSITMQKQFETVAKSLLAQILCALSYLHAQNIAHRDLKPDNILLNKSGCVKLIDFGVAFRDEEREEDKGHDIWPEYRDRLYFEVSTGAYRAPELLFGTRRYDAIAVDLWSIGATFAEFFTPLRLLSDDLDEVDEVDETEETKAFIIPRHLVGCFTSKWKRETLFNGERGEIGLAWSIFKISGTPTKENWPEFEDLPSARSVTFNVVLGVPLPPLLPNLPNYSANSTSDTVDLMTQFLKYPPRSRISASAAFSHPWLSSPILLPVGYKIEEIKLSLPTFEWSGRTLEDLLSLISPL